MGSPPPNPEVRSIAPGAWSQLNQPLWPRVAVAGSAKVERISGRSRFVTYGVLNDMVNSDGSYLPMTVP